MLKLKRININDEKPTLKTENDFFTSESLPILKNRNVLLYGKGGIGKSYAALRVALEAKSKNYEVLYLSFEENYDTMSERAKKLSTIFNFNCEAPYIETDFSKKLFNEFEKVILTNKINLVVIDTLSTFLRKIGLKENDNDDITEFYNRLRDIIHNSNNKGNDLSFLITHHSGKNAEAGTRGASSITDGAKLVYYLSKESENKDSAFLNVEYEKDNDGIKKYFYVEKIQTDEIGSKEAKSLLSKNDDNLIVDNNQDELISFKSFKKGGFVAVNELRAMTFLPIKSAKSSAERAEKQQYCSEVETQFIMNGRRLTARIDLPNNEGYIERTIKNELLTQTHRTILDGIMRYRAFEVRERILYGENMPLLTVEIEPYKLLKQLGKNTSQYKWLKEIIKEIANFSYDLKIVLLKDNNKITKEFDVKILSYEMEEEENLTKKEIEKNKWKIYLDPKYARVLEKESLLDYSTKLPQLAKINNNLLLDIIRYFFTTSHKEIMFNDLCKERGYNKLCSHHTINKVKKILLDGKYPVKQKRLIKENDKKEFKTEIKEIINLNDFGLHIEEEPVFGDIFIKYKRPNDVRYYNKPQNKIFSKPKKELANKEIQENLFE